MENCLKLFTKEEIENLKENHPDIPLERLNSKQIFRLIHPNTSDFHIESLKRKRMKNIYSKQY